MPTTLATLRANLQIILDDAAADLWTTAQLDQHIQDALLDFSRSIPQEKKTSLATVSGNRDLDISSLTDRYRVRAVEYKTGNWPRTFVNFSVWINTLTFIDEEPDGANADLYWEAPHVINGTDTLPSHHDRTLLFGAAAFACDQQQADATNQVNTGGAKAPRDWAGLARHFRSRYEGRKNAAQGIRAGRLFATQEPLPSQTTDPGP